MMDNIVEINGKKYKAGPWQIWNGGENPIADNSLVQPQFHSVSREYVEDIKPEPADFFIWSWNTEVDRIVCYRVMEEVKPEVVEFVTYTNVPCKPAGCYNVAKITFNLVDGTPDPKSIKMTLV